MINIDECINNLMDKSLDYNFTFKELLSCFREGQYNKLIESEENSLRYAIELYQLNRELLLSLYELMPSVPRTKNVYMVCRELLNISVERSKDFSFAVYKISLPILLPNKRKRKVKSNCIITESVGNAVSQFCSENQIKPFAHATVIFLSYHQSGGTTIDNDNLDSAVITNSLNGRFLRDDRPGVCNTIYYSKTVRSAKKVKTEIYVVNSDYDTEVLSFIKSTYHK